MLMGWLHRCGGELRSGHVLAAMATVGARQLVLHCLRQPGQQKVASRSVVQGVANAGR